MIHWQLTTNGVKPFQYTGHRQTGEIVFVRDESRHNMHLDLIIICSNHLVIQPCFHFLEESQEQGYSYSTFTQVPMYAATTVVPVKCEHSLQEKVFSLCWSIDHQSDQWFTGCYIVLCMIFSMKLHTFWLFLWVWWHAWGVVLISKCNVHGMSQSHTGSYSMLIVVGHTACMASKQNPFNFSLLY